MLFEIKHRFTGTVLFALETTSIKLCLEAAIKSWADLAWANFARADLAGAEGTWADFTGADFTGADLARANFTGANFTGADFTGADLAGANFAGANFTWADFTWADFTRANFTGANFARVNFTRVNFTGADLYGTEGINPNRCTPLLMLLDQSGKIRAYKLVNSLGEGPFNGGIIYEIGKPYAVTNACTDITKQCAVGISLATLDWCMKEWREGYRILIAEFTAKDIAAIPTATDGKFRVHKCKIVGEKDLVEIGLVPAPASVPKEKKAAKGTKENPSVS